MTSERRRERLWRARDKYAPDTPQGMRIAAKLAEEIAKLKELDTRPLVKPDPSYAGIEIFEEDTKPELVITSTYRVLPEAQPLPEKIERIDDPRSLPIIRKIVEELDREGELSDGTIQAIQDAPFAEDMRETMRRYIIVQKHQRGLGPPLSAAD